MHTVASVALYVFVVIWIVAAERKLAQAEQARDRQYDQAVEATGRALRAERELVTAQEALEIIAGYRPCADTLMSHRDVVICALNIICERHTSRNY